MDHFTLTRFHGATVSPLRPLCVDVRPADSLMMTSPTASAAAATMPIVTAPSSHDKGNGMLALPPGPCTNTTNHPALQLPGVSNALLAVPLPTDSLLTMMLEDEDFRDLLAAPEVEEATNDLKARVVAFKSKDVPSVVSASSGSAVEDEIARVKAVMNVGSSWHGGIAFAYNVGHAANFDLSITSYNAETDALSASRKITTKFATQSDVCEIRCFVARSSSSPSVKVLVQMEDSMYVCVGAMCSGESRIEGIIVQGQHQGKFTLERAK